MRSHILAVFLIVAGTTACKQQAPTRADAIPSTPQEAASSPDVNTPMHEAAMARLYIDKGIKLDSALALLDDAAKTLASESYEQAAKIPPDMRRDHEAFIALQRARAYLALHKPELAVPEAKIAIAKTVHNAEAHEILAVAYDAAGRPKQALDEYFEAALLPSNKDLEYRAELERYYRKSVGNGADFQAELSRRIAARAAATNYVPSLLDKSAPALEFTTFKGEKFKATELRHKIVVLNFWSPT